MYSPALSLLIACGCAMSVSTATIAQHGSPEPSHSAEAPTLRDAQPQDVDDALRRKQEIHKAIEEFNAMRPRRGYLTSSNRVPAFAAYFERWAADVVLVGNRRLKELGPRKSGEVVATVSILASGQLEDVEIDRSSGSENIDDMVKRIAYAAAPFAPFPPEIASRFAVLDVTATWVFSGPRENESEMSIASGVGIKEFEAIAANH